jgi:hypothetical protein
MRRMSLLTKFYLLLSILWLIVFFVIICQQLSPKSTFVPPQPETTPTPVLSSSVAVFPHLTTVEKRNISVKSLVKRIRRDMSDAKIHRLLGKPDLMLRPPQTHDFADVGWCRYGLDVYNCRDGELLIGYSPYLKVTGWSGPGFQVGILPEY